MRPLTIVLLAIIGCLSIAGAYFAYELLRHHNAGPELLSPDVKEHLKDQDFVTTCFVVNGDTESYERDAAE